MNQGAGAFLETTAAEVPLAVAPAEALVTDLDGDDDLDLVLLDDFGRTHPVAARRRRVRRAERGPPRARSARG